jgi:molybdopterin converting factor small subunit
MQVEFFGIPRERAGVDSLEIRARTLGELLATLKFQLPSFGDFIGLDFMGADFKGSARLHGAFAANLNGDRFVSDPATPLRDTDRLLILSADAGG